MGEIKPNLVKVNPTWMDFCVDLGPNLVNFGPNIAEFGTSLANLGPSLVEFGPSLAKLGLSLAKFGPPVWSNRDHVAETAPDLAEVGPMWPKSTQIWSTSVQICSNMAQIWSTSAQISPDSSQIWPHPHLTWRWALCRRKRSIARSRVISRCGMSLTWQPSAAICPQQISKVKFKASDQHSSPTGDRSASASGAPGCAGGAATGGSGRCTASPWMQQRSKLSNVPRQHVALPRAWCMGGVRADASGARPMRPGSAGGLGHAPGAKLCSEDPHMRPAMSLNSLQGVRVDAVARDERWSRAAKADATPAYLVRMELAQVPPRAVAEATSSRLQMTSEKVERPPGSAPHPRPAPHPAWPGP